MLLVGLAVYLNYRWFYDPAGSLGYGDNNMDDTLGDGSEETGGEAEGESENDYFRYSGNCLALLYSMNALYVADYSLWYELRLQYPDYISADMAAQNEYVNSYDTKVAEVSDKVNDTYLKLNDQQDGVRSYGKMVDLLLAYRRSL